MGPVILPLHFPVLDLGLRTFDCEVHAIHVLLGRGGLCADLVGRSYSQRLRQGNGLGVARQALGQFGGAAAVMGIDVADQRFRRFEPGRGRCHAKVTLSWQDSDEWLGESEGLASQSGELRCAAEACVIALTKATKSELRFELLGVKAVRAFDANVVIVSLSLLNGNETQRLVGCLFRTLVAARRRALPPSTPSGGSLQIRNVAGCRCRAGRENPLTRC